MESDRVVQTDMGTWLAHWSPAAYGKTPSMEESAWLCAPCFRRWCDFVSTIPPAFAIDWKKLAEKHGQEQADQLRHIIANHRHRAWERVEQIHELHLKKDIRCKACHRDITNEVLAFVEVF
jgi:hypothetical protein